jgi:hypothetical protein
MAEICRFVVPSERFHVFPDRNWHRAEIRAKDLRFGPLNSGIPLGFGRALFSFHSVLASLKEDQRFMKRAVGCGGGGFEPPTFGL